MRKNRILRLKQSWVGPVSYRNDHCLSCMISCCDFLHKRTQWLGLPGQDCSCNSVSLPYPIQEATLMKWQGDGDEWEGVAACDMVLEVLQEMAFTTFICFSSYLKNVCIFIDSKQLECVHTFQKVCHCLHILSMFI